MDFKNSVSFFRILVSTKLTTVFHEQLDLRIWSLSLGYWFGLVSLDIGYILQQDKEKNEVD